MRKNIFKALLLVLIAIAALDITPIQADAASKLSKTKITLTAGKSITLKSKSRTNKKWKTSNKKIAKISKKKAKSVKITAIKPGKATVSVKIGKKTYKCKVTVKAAAPKKTPPSSTPTPTPAPKPTPTPPAKSNTPYLLQTTMKLCTLNDYSNSISWETGERYNKLIVKDAVGTTTFKSSNTNIATVDKNGIVTGKTDGKATIIAINSGVTMTCVVEVSTIQSSDWEPDWNWDTNQYEPQTYTLGDENRSWIISFSAATRERLEKISVTANNQNTGLFPTADRDTIVYDDTRKRWEMSYCIEGYTKGTTVITARDSLTNKTYTINVNVTSTHPYYAKYQALLDSIIAQKITPGMTDTQKVTAIFKYIEEAGWCYDSGATSAYSIVAAEPGRGNCFASASFGRDIFRKMGYEAQFVMCVNYFPWWADSGQSIGHAFTIIKFKDGTIQPDSGANTSYAGVGYTAIDFSFPKR